ncbi:MAG: four helix bundle protein [Patescibacteria group bacterium]|nr:four helix bundle protein [Patescibacteria group bacterium]
MNEFQEKLKFKMDEYAHLVYQLTKEFPRDELYGVTSQIRRAGLSVILNYLEGYARIKSAVQLNFYEISYGSLKETKYLLYFSMKENYLNHNDYKIALKLAEEIGAMLWTQIRFLNSKTTKR